MKPKLNHIYEMRTTDENGMLVSNDLVVFTGNGKVWSCLRNNFCNESWEPYWTENINCHNLYETESFPHINIQGYCTTIESITKYRLTNLLRNAMVKGAYSAWFTASVFSREFTVRKINLDNDSLQKLAYAVVSINPSDNIKAKDNK